jgi:hypothetical protein
MRFSFIILLFVFTFGFVIAEESCLTQTCNSDNETLTVGQISYYCNVLEGVFCTAKQSGESCLNDFECVSPYSCLGEICTGEFNSIVNGYNLIAELLPGYCPAYEDESRTYFCSNSTNVSNAFMLANKNCTANYNCFKCNGTAYTYNSTLNICTKGNCESTTGQFCLNASVLNSSEKEGYYCSNNKKCFSCDSNFDWNINLSQCILRPCTSSPGCMNITNLTNGQLVENRRCDVGSCFICKTGYAWNANTSSCVLSSGSISTTMVKVPVSASDLAAGKYNLLGLNDRVSLSFAGRTYYFDLLGIDSSKISFEIYPTFSDQILSSGSNRGFDFDNDGTYDLRISYAGIASGNANVSLQYISEFYATQTPEVITTNTPQTSVPVDQVPSTAVDSSKSNIWIFLIIGFIIILLIIILFFFLVKNGNPSKPSSTRPTNPAPQQQRPPMAPGNAPVANYPVGGYRPMPPRPVMPQNPQFR